MNTNADDSCSAKKELQTHPSKKDSGTNKTATEGTPQMTAGRKNINSLSKHWGTPHKYAEAVRRVFGGIIHLDPCSNQWSIIGAQTEWSLPDEDGLTRVWSYPTIYVNPPYGANKETGTRIGDWLRKCADAQVAFGSEVIALVPVAANTLHWKESVWARATSICFLYDTRLMFLENGRAGGKGAPMACAAIYWGAQAGGFAAQFSKHGAVLHLDGVALPTGKLARQKSLCIVPPARKAG